MRAGGNGGRLSCSQESDGLNDRIPERSDRRHGGGRAAGRSLFGEEACSWRRPVVTTVHPAAISPRCPVSGTTPSFKQANSLQANSLQVDSLDALLPASCRAGRSVNPGPACRRRRRRERDLPGRAGRVGRGAGRSERCVAGSSVASGRWSPSSFRSGHSRREPGDGGNGARPAEEPTRISISLP
jgi:hypothetical protein